MRILFVVDPHLPVPPRDYGGIERIVAGLASELNGLGHQVDLIAGPGSQSFGGTLVVHRAPGLGFFSRSFRKIWFQFLSLPALLRADVVLNFGRLDYLETALRLPVPLICCFQNPVSHSEVDWLNRRRSKRLALVAISEAQIEDLPERDRFIVVPNATDVDATPYRPEAEEPPYLAFLGRVTRNKGADIAIRVARRSGMKLRIAGNISNEEGGIEFFENEVRPALSPNVEWVGPVNDEQKQILLGGASALLFPIRWPEPFGIVMVESLACGTPVIATRCASTPEVIDDGVTGFLCDDEDEMVGAVAKLSTIDRSECRAAAKTKFSVEVMVQNYLRNIENLIGPEVPET